MAVSEKAADFTSIQSVFEAYMRTVYPTTSPTDPDTSDAWEMLRDAWFEGAMAFALLLALAPTTADRVQRLSDLTAELRRFGEKSTPSGRQPS